MNGAGTFKLVNDCSIVRSLKAFKNLRATCRFVIDDAYIILDSDWDWKRQITGGIIIKTVPVLGNDVR